MTASLPSASTELQGRRCLSGPKNRPRHCGRRGCVEAHAGRRSMAGVVSAMVDAGRSTSLYRIQEEEGKTRLTSKVWARALAEEDALAGELFDLAVEMIGVGIGSAVNVLDLELVVIGGGLAEKLGQDLADRLAGAAARGCCDPTRTCGSWRPSWVTTRAWWARRRRHGNWPSEGEPRLHRERNERRISYTHRTPTRPTATAARSSAAAAEA